SHRSHPSMPAPPHSRQCDGHSRAVILSTSVRIPKLTGGRMLPRLPASACRRHRSFRMPAISEPRAGDASAPEAVVRHDWTRGEVEALFALPFTELLHRAASVHRAHFDPAQVQVSTLLSVKTGGCPEDCAYCPQAQRYHTGVQATKLMSLDAVLDKA